MMNIRDPTKKEPKQISIFVGTWNMGKLVSLQVLLQLAFFMCFVTNKRFAYPTVGVLITLVNKCQCAIQGVSKYSLN